MYKQDFAIDLKEGAVIQRRRQQEQERQSRIFNSKTRQIGIDKQALDQQIKEKKEREELIRKSDLAYISDAIRHDKIAVLLENKQKHDIQEYKKALNEFRSLHQQAESRREWDLYDPSLLKKEKPSRICDDDPRCGASSMQKFDGEDLSNKERNEQQKKMMKCWHEMQVLAKKRAEEAEKEANRLADLKIRELDERACDLATAEDTCRKAIHMANRLYNEALARENDERARLRKQQENDDCLTDIINSLQSDILTENPAQSASRFGNGRILASRYKGLSPEEIHKLGEEHQKQILEKKQLESEERERNLEWDRQRLAQAKAAMLLERAENEKRRSMEKDIALENMRLCKEQTMHTKFLDNEVYTNHPTAAYFQQFNKSSR